jgi:hypothetical protein
MIHSLRTYLTAHDFWKSTNEKVIVERLMHKALANMHTVLEQRLLFSNTDNGSSIFATRSVAMTGNPKLTGKFLFCTTPMRMMELSSNNEFWGSNGLHTSRFVHELMIDPNFSLSMKDTMPRLFTKCTKALNSACRVNTSGIFLDIASVIMWSCKKAEYIIELAENMDMPSNSIANMPVMVDRIIKNVICAIITPNKANGLLMEWDSIKSQAPDERKCLSHLLHCTITMRNAISNIEIDKLRTNQFNELANYMMRWDQVIPLGDTTRHWIQTALMEYDIESLRGIAEGNPFALLNLHDNAVIDLVFPSLVKSRSNTSITLHPDILLFDMDRLNEIQETFLLYSTADVGNPQSFRFLFRELVKTGEIYPLSTSITEAAEKLRSVLFVCRVRHGQTVARYAREIARSLLDFDPIITRTTQPTRAG